MSTLNNRRPPGKPSLFGSNHPSLDDTPVTNRVLAHLEGRDRAASTNAKTVGGGVLAVLLVGAGGLYAWQQSAPENGSPSPSAPAVVVTPASSSQQVAQVPQPLNETMPQPQPARIVQESASSQASGNETTTSNSPLTSLASAVPAPRTQRTSSPTQPAQRAGSEVPTPGSSHAASAKKAGHPKANEVKTVQASDSHKTSAKRATAAKSKAQPRQNADPDAELLAALLQRRDPRP